MYRRAEIGQVARALRVLDALRGFKQLEQRMSEKERAELAAFGEHFNYLPDHGTKSYQGKDDIIDAIQTGILSRKVVRYRYADGRGRPREGFVAPFGMVVYRHGLYVIGARLDHAKADPATSPLGIFAIERFADAEHLREHEFVVPADFDIRKHMHGAFGPLLNDATGPHDIVVEFSSARAMYASSRTWHPAQHIEQLSNGRVRISFRIPALAPVVSWILEWGPHARAIAPDALVAQVASELEEARAQHGSTVEASNK